MEKRSCNPVLKSRSVTDFSKVYEANFNEILQKIIVFALVKPHLIQNVNCEWFKSKEPKSFESLLYESECGVFFSFYLLLSLS